MTKKEASFILANIDRRVCDDELSEALDMSIKALEQEPCCNCIEFKRYAKEMGFEIEQESILEKIRDEIDSAKMPKNRMSFFRDGIDCALQIIDKYRGESEGV